MATKLSLASTKFHVLCICGAIPEDIKGKLAIKLQADTTFKPRISTCICPKILSSFCRWRRPESDWPEPGMKKHCILNQHILCLVLMRLY